MSSIDTKTEIRRAETATQHVHRWGIVERPLDIEVSCEISGNLPTNKQSRTNSGLSTRVQEDGGWHYHPYETLQMPYDLASTGRQPISLTPTASGLPRERTGAMGDNPDRKSGRVPCRKGGVDRLHRNGQTPTPRSGGSRILC